MKKLLRLDCEWREKMTHHINWDVSTSSWKIWSEDKLKWNINRNSILFTAFPSEDQILTGRDAFLNSYNMSLCKEIIVHLIVVVLLLLEKLILNHLFFYEFARKNRNGLMSKSRTHRQSSSIKFEFYHHQYILYAIFF